MTQNNLGNALQILGERESGTTQLQDAVQAYQNALTEWTQDRVPLDWAATQFNLGGVYIIFFDKSSDPAHLETAETHLQAALAVFDDAAPYNSGMARKALQDITTRRSQG